jgi:large subunit ribosomal protein L15
MIIKGKVKDKKKKIIGRGFGSGKGGHTSTRGMKGQNSRAGSHISKYFEGGQNPLIQRVPYLKGFKRYSVKIEILNLGFIDKYFNDGDSISLKSLQDRGFVRKIK